MSGQNHDSAVRADLEPTWGKGNTPETSWAGFAPGPWQHEVDVRDFIQRNVTPYTGDHSFLAVASETTKALWSRVMELRKEEHEKGGVLDADTSVPSDLLAHDAGYIDPSLESIVGLQTEKPLKRAIMPTGGVKMVVDGLKAYGYKIDPAIQEIFGRYRKSHNQGVFDAYTSEMRAVRKSGIITGLGSSSVRTMRMTSSRLR